MNNNFIEQKKNTHLFFQVGKNKYAVNTTNVLEIMKLPALDYPQKLPNNIIGLLKYNNFVINVIDIRFYLNIEVTPYNHHNELLIVKTDEVIFGIVTDKIIGILPFDSSLVDQIPFVDNNMIIESLYKFDDETKDKIFDATTLILSDNDETKNHYPKFEIIIDIKSMNAKQINQIREIMYHVRSLYEERSSMYEQERIVFTRTKSIDQLIKEVKEEDD